MRTYFFCFYYVENEDELKYRLFRDGYINFRFEIKWAKNGKRKIMFV